VVAREEGVCRSGRKGTPASSHVLRGWRERFEGDGAGGGMPHSLRQQESECSDAHGDVMIPADVVASLEVVEAQLALEILVVAFDAPTPLDEGDEIGERRVGREVGHPVLRGPVVPLGPFGNQPQFGLVSEGRTIVFGQAHATARKREDSGFLVPSRQVTSCKALGPSERTRSQMDRGDDDFPPLAIDSNTLTVECIPTAKSSPYISRTARKPGSLP